MPNGTVIKYPLDLTGRSADNLITGELHQFSTIGQKAFVLNYGLFYVDSLVVRDTTTNQVLKLREQYVPTQLMVDMTLRTGKDVCSVIVITDDSLPDNLQVSVDYQVVGGPYSASVDAIQQLIDALDLGNSPINWKQILGKPVSYPPAPHLHDVGDVYGFEYVVAAIERLVQAIYLGDQEQFEAIYQYVDHQDGLLQDGIDATNTSLLNHINDKNNPHNTTKAQVGLGNADNTSDIDKPISTAQQAALDTKATLEESVKFANVTASYYRATEASVSTIGGALAFRLDRTNNNKIQFCEDKSAIRSWLEFGSAAMKNTSYFATSAQGARADAAMPKSWVLNSTGNSTTKPISQYAANQAVTNVMKFEGFGTGTYRSMSVRTTYTNTWDKPIFFSGWGHESGDNSIVYARVNGSVIGQSRLASHRQWTATVSVTAICPPGDTFRVDGRPTGARMLV